jgi:hypothetical protein
MSLHVSVHIYDHLQGAREQYFVQLLNLILLMYIVHRTATESNLVTAQSTAHEPPEDGRIYGPKHIGATSLKCFNVLLCVLSINVN